MRSELHFPIVVSMLHLNIVNGTANRITVEPVREHLEQVLWARLEELIERR